MILTSLPTIENEHLLCELIKKNDTEGFNQIIDSCFALNPGTKWQKEDLLGLIKYLDLTSLSSTDNNDSIKSLIEKSEFEYNDVKHLVAGVCVFPNFLPLIKDLCRDKHLKAIVVAGGFPFSQMPLEVKKEEVRYALEFGADEIDVCINRGMFLGGDIQGVANEIREIKNLIKTYSNDVKLKVILEVGELRTYSNIYSASMLALESGADFIKTSTGKIAKGADVYSVCVMLLALRLFYKKTGMLKGLKVAGGIRSCFDALQYKNLFDRFMIKGLNDNKYFRIGCSKLFENIKSEILNGENDKIKHNL